MLQDNFITVTQFNSYVKNIIDNEHMLKNVQISGELSQFNIVRGITYFVIKDKESILNCVMFSAREFTDYKVGDQVIVRGNADYYLKGGKLNFKTFSIEKKGQGDIYKEFLMLKQKLKDEGLFDDSIKKSIPKFPEKVGIITSRTGSVIKDIINVSKRRNRVVNLYLYHSNVQGNYASKDIIKGVEFFNDYDVDVIVIARGGGSIEDLQPFNDEPLARKIHNSKKPIISAVGHETDFTICDFVSDLRAPTPSAAAEIITSNFVDEMEKLDMLAKKILYVQTTLINTERVYLTSRLEQLKMIIDRNIKDKFEMISNLDKTLSIINPENILSKGYARIEKNDRLIKSYAQLDKNDDIVIHFKDGKHFAKIKSKKED